MKKNLLFVFMSLLLLTALLSCSSSDDGEGKVSFSSSQIVGTWQTAGQGDTYYVFKSDGTGLYVDTKSINSANYVAETRCYRYSCDESQKSIYLEFTDDKGDHSQILSNAKMEYGVLSFSENGKSIDCYALEEPKWFVEIVPDGIQAKESSRGLMYACSRFGGSFRIRLNPLCIWHESAGNVSLSMSRDESLGNAYRFHMVTENDSQHNYLFNFDAYRVDGENLHRMLVGLTDASGKSVYQTQFYISQDGSDFSNPSVVGSWNRRNYDYQTESDYYFVFKENGTGIMVKDPDSYESDKGTETSFTYIYNPMSKSIAMIYSDGSKDEIQDVEIQNKSSYEDQLTGLLVSTHEKLTLVSHEYAFCRIEYKSLDAKLSHIGGLSDTEMAYICYTNEDKTLRFEITPKYYFHRSVAEECDFELNPNSGKSSATYKLAKGVPALLTVTVPKTSGYGGNYDVVIEKKQTSLSYGALVRIPIRQEYKHVEPQPDPDNPDTPGGSDEESTFIIYPQMNINDPHCTARYMTWDGTIRHYQEYESGLKVKKDALGRYTASIMGTRYTLYKGRNSLRLLRENCKGHATQYGVATSWSYHQLEIIMNYNITE